MMMALVHALLQPNCSLYNRNNEGEYINRHSVTENQDRGPKTRIVTVNNNVTKHVAQASTEVANGKEINHSIDEQHADKRHEIHIFTENDVSKVSKSKRPNEVNVTEEAQIKLYESQIQNKQRYMKEMTNLIETIYHIDIIQLSNLIILLKKKVYLYLISQILQYNHSMEIDDKTTIANWKINAEIYDRISKYLKILSMHRIYFIIWKLLSLIMDDILAFKEIIWRWSKIDKEYEERTETIKIKQEGIKIIIYLVNSEMKYDIIGMLGTKVNLNAEIIAEYVEVLDLTKAYKEHRPLPIENDKFNKRRSNIDKNIWIKSGEIIAKDCIKEVWDVMENCAILCKESNDELSNESNGYMQRSILDHESKVNEVKDDEQDS